MKRLLAAAVAAASAVPVLLAHLVGAAPASAAAAQSNGYDVVRVPGASSNAQDVNDSGVVVGSRQRDESGSTTIWRWEDGVFHDLPELPGADPEGAWPRGDWALGQAFVNERGDVLGVTGGPHGSHLVMWTVEGPVIDLGAPPDDRVGQVVGFNAAQQVVVDFDVLYNSAWIWQDGTFEWIGGFGTAGASASSLNELGQVVGSAKHTSGYYSSYLWEDGVKRDLGVVQYGSVLLNDQGDLALVKTPGRRTLLLNHDGTRYELDGTAVLLNDDGTVVVLPQGLGTSPPQAPLVWRDGAVVATLETGTEFIQWTGWRSINERGDILAESEVMDIPGDNFDYDYRALVYPAGSSVPVRLPLPDDSTVFLNLKEINDQGIVIGRGGWVSTHGYIWVPRIGLPDLPPLAPLTQETATLVRDGHIAPSTGRTITDLLDRAELHRSAGRSEDARTLLIELARTLDASTLAKVDAHAGKALRAQLDPLLPQPAPLDALRRDVRLLLEDGHLRPSLARRLVAAVPASSTPGSLVAFSASLERGAVSREVRDRLQALVDAATPG